MELPLTVQLVSVVGAVWYRSSAAALERGGVAADGGVGQRGRAIKGKQAAAVLAELPLTVQLVSVVVPPSLYTPPPKRCRWRSCR